MQPQIVLLKEGTDTSQGKNQLVSNINACKAIADLLSTTLGPRGMDKLIKVNGKANISNDGATLIKLLDIVHPAAKTMAEIASSQDREIGDGTTSVVLLAAELLNNAKEFVEDGVSPQEIIEGYQTAMELAIDLLEQQKILSLKDGAEKENKKILQKCAETALTSKLIEGQKEFFAKMLVDAYLRHKKMNSIVLKSDNGFLNIKSIPGGSVTDSFLVDGIAFEKTFSYAGFEQQPKYIKHPSIALLNFELELKTEHVSGEVRVSPSQYQSIVDAEWNLLQKRLNYIVDSGANVILSKLPIGDLATQFFADRNIFCAGRVMESDLHRLALFSDGKIQTSLRSLDNSVLGHCALFEEKQIGKKRYNFFTFDKAVKHIPSHTLILRGGAEQYIDEAERSLNDAAMIIRSTGINKAVVAGGGAIEMETSLYLRTKSREIKDKKGFIISAFAKSLEVIPLTLAKNAGMDSTSVLNALRSAHSQGKCYYGVDIDKDSICDTFKAQIWEPLASKKNIYSSAIEAAALILSVDETIRTPKSEENVAMGNPMGNAMMR